MLHKWSNNILKIINLLSIIVYVCRISCANQIKSTNNVILSTHGGNTVLENISCIYGSKQVNLLF